MQTKCPKKKQHKVHVYSQTQKQSASLPRGLIGAKCTAQVTICDKDCSCLLDSGSQVTTIPNSFYLENLSQLPLNSLNNLLEVEGANGQSVPYLRYIETIIKFPKSLLGADIEVPTLALVVPDKGSTLSSVLIGTNTLDVLYEQYAEIVPQDCESLPYGYRVVLKTLEIRKRQSIDSSLEKMRLHGTDFEVIAAGQTKVLEGSVSCRTPNIGKWVMVKSPKSASLPGGILVTDSLVTLPSQRPRCIPVILKNESHHDIALSCCQKRLARQDP